MPSPEFAPSSQRCPTAMPWLREIEAIVTLRQVWADRFTDPPGPLRFKSAQERAASAELIASPYDTEARYATKREMPWVEMPWASVLMILSSLGAYFVMKRIGLIR